MKYKVYASKNKNDLKADIEDIVKPLIQHLIKFYNYPENVSRNKWIHEIYGFYNSVPKFRHNNKIPSAKFLFDCFWNGNEDYYDAFYNGIIQTYEAGGNITPHTKEETKQFVINYFNWLAQELSTEKYASEYAVKQELLRLENE